MSSSVVLVEILKNIYGNPRPFWINPNLFLVCEGGFGNPSGHSVCSMSIFLALWTTIFEFKQKKEINSFVKFPCLISCFIMIFLVIFSRLYLAAHSFNQVCYGASIGFCIYFAYYRILQLHKMETEDFYDFFIKGKKILINYIILISSFSTILLVYFLKENESKPYVDILNTKCPKLKPYKKFNENGLYGGMVIFIFTGCYTGIIILLRVLINKDDFQYELYTTQEKNVRLLSKLEAINQWNQIDFIKRLYILVIFCLCSIPISINLIIPSNSKLWIIYMFKTAVPFFIMGLFSFALTIYCSFKFKISSLEIDYETLDVKRPFILDDLEYKNVEIKK